MIITNAEAVQAANTLRAFCNQFVTQEYCGGCPFYCNYKDEPLMQSSCRLFAVPANYNLHTVKNNVETGGRI